jgi:hypothetical protein
MQNMTGSGGMMNFDMVCSNQNMNGKGHVSVSYSGDTSYSGNMTFAGTAQGRPLNMNNTFSGRWMSADCGGVTH